MIKDQLIRIPILILAGTFHGTQNGLHLAGNKKKQSKAVSHFNKFPNIHRKIPVSESLF